MCTWSMHLEYGSARFAPIRQGLLLRMLFFMRCTCCNGAACAEARSPTNAAETIADAKVTLRNVAKRSDLICKGLWPTGCAKRCGQKGDDRDQQVGHAAAHIFPIGCAFCFRGAPRRAMLKHRVRACVNLRWIRSKLIFVVCACGCMAPFECRSCAVSIPLICARMVTSDGSAGNYAG